MVSFSKKVKRLIQRQSLIMVFPWTVPSLRTLTSTTKTTSSRSATSTSRACKRPRRKTRTRSRSARLTCSLSKVMCYVLRTTRVPCWKFLLKRADHLKIRSSNRTCRAPMIRMINSIWVWRCSPHASCNVMRSYMNSRR